MGTNFKYEEVFKDKYTPGELLEILKTPSVSWFQQVGILFYLGETKAEMDLEELYQVADGFLVDEKYRECYDLVGFVAKYAALAVLRKKNSQLNELCFKRLEAWSIREREELVSALKQVEEIEIAERVGRIKTDDVKNANR